MSSLSVEKLQQSAQMLRREASECAESAAAALKSAALHSPMVDLRAKLMQSAPAAKGDSPAPTTPPTDPTESRKPRSSSSAAGLREDGRGSREAIEAERAAEGEGEAEGEEEAERARRDGTSVFGMSSIGKGLSEASTTARPLRTHWRSIFGWSCSFDLSRLSLRCVDSRAFVDAGDRDGQDPSRRGGIA